MIQQPAPTDQIVSGLQLEAHLPYRLSLTSNAVSRLIARAYEDRFGLTIPQWRLICALVQDGPMTRADLVARTVTDRGIVGRAVQGLLKRNLLERDGKAADSRSDVLRVTPEGLRLHGEIAPLALAYEAALISGLAPAEAALLRRLLARLQAAAQSLGGVGL